jgi:uncharacterized lipoprotein YddW (UPF0748 family)
MGIANAVGASGEAPANAVYSRTAEIRAVWMDRNSIPKTEQGIRELVRTYAQSGINVLLPETIYNGYSAYPGAVMQQQNLWNGLDMLGILIDEAHKNGLEVHPWVWVFRAGNASDHGGILKKHPEWAAVDRNGNTLSANNGYWLCPSTPDVRAFLLAAYEELARKYPIDGLHLDYIRFEVESPEPYCYNASCRTKFKAQYGIDPMDAEQFTKAWLDWQMWREEEVNTFVATVCDSLKKIRPGIKISAAVGADPDDARVSLCQDWGHWADNKWVDMLCPMAYSSDSAYFKKVVDSESARVSNKALLAPGIGLFAINNVSAVLDQIGITQSRPSEGCTLFASAYLDSARLKALSEGPFRSKAVLPLRSPLESVKELMSSVKSRLENQTSITELSEAHVDLATAANLLDYSTYQMKEVGYVPATPAPIFIPDKVQLIPQVDIPQADSAPKIDGRLDDFVWKHAAAVRIDHTALGYAASQHTDVLLLCDKDNLYIGFRCYDPSPDKVKAVVKTHEGPVFQDDAVEVFLGLKGDSYLHFAMNAIGTKFEQRVYDTGVNWYWIGATGREPGAWTAEIAIPLSTIGVTSASGTLRGNFCRDRIVDGKVEASCWSETYGSFHTPIRFGSIKLR